MNQTDRSTKTQIQERSGFLLKFVDVLVFVAIVYFGVHYYQINHLVFDLIGLSGLIYIAIRKPDLNTLTVIFILFMTSAIPAIAIYGHGQLGGYSLYSTLFVVNLVGVLAIWSRPFVLLRFGPDWLRNRAAELNPTKQDQVLGILFSIQAFWQLMQFLEHLTRHRADIGLGHMFDDWKPMLFYNMYKTGQLSFSILTLLILYFMTFDKSGKPA